MWTEFTLLLVFAVCCCSTFNILGIFPQVYRSHSLIYNPIMFALAKRGHNVTSYSYYQIKSNLTNFHQIDIKSCLPKKSLYDSINLMRTPTHLSHLNLIYVELPSYWNLTACKPLADLLDSQQQFDALITQPFNSDLFSAFAYKLNVTTSVHVFSTQLFSWLLDRMGSPTNPSYIPERGSHFVTAMNFLERVENAYVYVFSQLYYRLYFQTETERIYRAVFDSHGPPLEDIAANTSLILANTHFTLFPAMPLVPGIVQVAGVNIVNASKLPQNIEIFINESEHGVIYFSMGSLLQGESFPEEKRNAFLNAFSKIQQRILWKWEGDVLPGKSDKIMISKWMPQRDILAHPNIKLFITHGGLFGISEAVYEGVPILGIPIFGDQRTNVKAIQANGAGELLDYDDISEEVVLDKIQKIINNPKYQQNAKQLSNRYRDRPMSPLDTAVYWVEYVIRHKGALHLKTAAVNLSWYQYLLLDIIAFIIVILISLMILIYYLCKIVIKFIVLLWGNQKKMGKLSHKNKND